MNWSNVEELHLLIPKEDGGYVYGIEKVIAKKQYSPGPIVIRFKYTDPDTLRRVRQHLVVYGNSDVIGLKSEDRVEYGDLIISGAGMKELMKKYEELVEKEKDRYERILSCYEKLLEELKSL